MSLGALDAAAAYGRILSPGPRAAPPVVPTSGSEANFGNMVEQMIGGAAGAMRSAETASAQQIAGKGDLVDVVTAIGAAEQALETVVAVRDKVVNAYQDIMRMQI
jgi:flagellar hook-basal body complex protein FliE